MRVSVHIPDDIGEAARQCAKEEGVSVSQFYAQAVQQALEQRRRKEAHARVAQFVGSVNPEEYPRDQFDAVQHELRRDDLHRSR